MKTKNNNNIINNKELRSLILQYFQCISSGENVSQCIKQSLFLHPKFNPLLIFQLIGQSESQNKRIQTKKDWRNYLVSINIQFTQEQFQYFCHHNMFEQQIKFNDFMEAIIPYNADVLRIYRKQYLQLIEIRKLDAEVQAIFNQLVKFQIKFYGNLIKIKKQLASIASQQQILQFIKQDLIFENKSRNNVRQAVKYKEKFQLADFQFTFNELRRFLQLWQIPQQKNIQFELLQIKRHLKKDNPFQSMCLYTHKYKSSPTKNRSSSVNKISNKKKINYSSNTKRDLSSHQPNRYQNFKSQLFRELKNDNFTSPKQKYNMKNQNYYYADSQKTNLPSGLKTTNQKHPEARKLNFEQDQRLSKQNNLKNIRYQRDKKSINGELITKILQQINNKQHKLQKIRKKLATNHDFNLINLFKLVDKNNKGYASSKMIQEYLDTEMPFKYLVQYYARQKGRLRFQDFCMIFRPLSKKLNELLDQKQENRLPNPFKKESISLITQILCLSAQMFHTVYLIRQQINNSGITPASLFRYVDLNDKGYICAQDIENLLLQKNIQCQPRNLKCIMKIFGFRVDGKISLGQFQRFLDI